MCRKPRLPEGSLTKKSTGGGNQAGGATARRIWLLASAGVGVVLVLALAISHTGQPARIGDGRPTPAPTSQPPHTVTPQLVPPRTVSGQPSRTAGQLVRTLIGHTRGVDTVAVTPDGRQVVTGAGGDVLRVWNLTTGRKIRSFPVRSGDVMIKVAVTPDGQQLISGGGDTIRPDEDAVRIWDLASGRLVRTLRGQMPVAVTPDGRRLITGASEPNWYTMRIWDLATGRLIRTLNATGVPRIAVTPEGRQVITGAGDHTLQVWDLATGKLVRTLAGHISDVVAVAVTRDGLQVISGAHDNTLRVWDLATGKLVRTLGGPACDLGSNSTCDSSKVVWTVAVTPDGRQAISGGWDDGTIQVWDLATGRLVHTLRGHTGPVYDVVVTPDGQQVVSGSGDTTVRVWNLA